MNYKKILQCLKVGNIYFINNKKTPYKYTGIFHENSRTIEFTNPVGVSEKFTAQQIRKLESVKDPTSGMKFDGTDKLRWDLLPIEFEEVIAVLTKGAKKYADNNWMYVNPAYDRYLAAAYRHIQEFRKSIKKGLPRTDKEMGTHVLANAICCLIFLMYLDMNDWPNQKVKPTETKWRDKE